jgi:hypothetical protein
MRRKEGIVRKVVCGEKGCGDEGEMIRIKIDEMKRERGHAWKKGKWR